MPHFQVVLTSRFRYSNMYSAAWGHLFKLQERESTAYKVEQLRNAVTELRATVVGLKLEALLTFDLRAAFALFAESHPMIWIKKILILHTCLVLFPKLVFNEPA